MPELPTPAASRVISVTELNRLARNLLEDNLPLMWVGGEISNLKRYDSGHCYFTLKDAQAQVECVMFRHKFQYLDWLPDNGMQVEVRAHPTVYEARGKFQLNIENMRRAGLGALYEAFERLKAKLEKEGLFDAARKKPLPGFPRRVGVITSLQAAALRDVLTTLKRRMPSLPVVVYPAPVQGEGAGQKIAQAVGVAGDRGECDVLIVCRGGGSIEDLWAYNEEIVARAIHACPIPVVTGIGHETDFTIADFVADARAATPTAAAQLAAPDRSELCGALLQWRQRLNRIAGRALEDRMQRLDYLSRRLVHPGERISNRLEALRHLASRLVGAWRRSSPEQAWAARELAGRLILSRPDLEAREREKNEWARRLREATHQRLAGAATLLERIEAHLKHLNPRLVLERGYSIAETGDGRIVRDSTQVALDDELTIIFARGWAGAQVKRKG
ncbi:MAG: exodeoxyribonuclease VII large subunit [Betaproteobacteria bacterium]|nr:exodeoxyribonuclease VII large subunit [Betaproteobacteria bacterium]